MPRKDCACTGLSGVVLQIRGCRTKKRVRRPFFDELLAAGVSEALVIKQMGHVDPRTTREHYFYNNKNVSEMETLLSKIL